MGKADRSRVIRLAEAQAGIPGLAGERSVRVLQRGTCHLLGIHDARFHEVFIFASRDVVTRVALEALDLLNNHGTFDAGILGQRDPFESGDILFVAAGTEHHFEDFTKVLTLWRAFYGPHGGEVPA